MPCNSRVTAILATHPIISESPSAISTGAIIASAIAMTLFNAVSSAQISDARPARAC
jgi:hypothetical protein